jgi:hypothetical protein
MAEFGTLNLEEMAGEDARLKEQGGSAGFLDQFVPMPEVKPGQTGSVAVRVLPPVKGGKLFQYNRVHTINGRKVHCPRPLVNGKWDRNVACPICDYYSSLWRRSTRSRRPGKDCPEAKPLKDEARGMKPVERYYYNAIVRSMLVDGKELKNEARESLSSARSSTNSIIGPSSVARAIPTQQARQHHRPEERLGLHHPQGSHGRLRRLPEVRPSPASPATRAPPAPRGDQEVAGEPARPHQAPQPEGRGVSGEGTGHPPWPDPRRVRDLRHRGLRRQVAKQAQDDIDDAVERSHSAKKTSVTVPAGSSRCQDRSQSQRPNRPRHEGRDEARSGKPRDDGYRGRKFLEGTGRDGGLSTP